MERYRDRDGVASLGVLLRGGEPYFSPLDLEGYSRSSGLIANLSWVRAYTCWQSHHKREVAVTQKLSLTSTCRVEWLWSVVPM